MADDEPELPLITVEAGFPPATLPTVFADGVANMAPSTHAIKFYLYRTDPDQAGAGRYKNQVFAQVVMPIDAFVSASAFFEKSVRYLLEKEFITPEQVERIQKTYKP